MYNINTVIARGENISHSLYIRNYSGANIFYEMLNDFSLTVKAKFLLKMKITAFGILNNPSTAHSNAPFD